LQLEPGYSEAWYNLGLALQEDAQVHQAVEAYSKAIAIAPEMKEAWFNRGVLYMDQELTDKACMDFAMAAKLGDDDASKVSQEFCKSQP
jgi:superkiller protein 3